MPNRPYPADQNTAIFLYESGTYAVASGAGVWPGMVISHDVDENMNVNSLHFINNGAKQVGQFVDGPQDFTGTIEFHPQNFRSLYFALGSLTDAGSPSPYTHTYRESGGGDSAPETGEAMPSFQIEDAGRFVAGSNFVRTLKGCMVDKWTLSASEGEPYKVAIDYVAQTSLFTSGAVTAVTADTTRPFLWSDTVFHMPSGTRLNEVKELEFSIGNNLATFHYLNGSRVIGVPQATNREYELVVTTNSTNDWSKSAYEQYLVGGSTFNCIFSVTASTGSRVLTVTASGCKMLDLEAPTSADDVREMTLTIAPQNVTIVEDSTDQYYHAGSYA